MAEYTNAERVFRAMEAKQPDRIPHFELAVDRNVANAILPGASYEEFAEYMDWDALIHTDRPYGAGYLREEVLSENPRITRDEWGAVKRYTGELAPIPVKAPVKSEKDLENFKPPDPDDERRYQLLKKWVERYKGKRAIIAMVTDLNSIASDVLGFEDRLMAFYTNPELVLRVQQIILDYELRYINNAIEVGADVVFINGDWAYKNGPMFSMEHFNRFVYPPFKAMVAEAKKGGVYVMKHTDGNIKPLLNSIVEAGINALNPIDPNAGMDIGEVKKKYGDRLCLVGNVDCAYALTFGSVEDVKRTTKEVIRKAGSGGGLIISSSNSIHSAVPPENYLEMVKTIRDYGKYPLDMAALS